MTPVAALHDSSGRASAVPGKSLLRFLTCGSVDDGKSTLIGRLLFDSKLLFDDQLSVLESDSRRYGTVGDNLDFALLVDGLQAEREQGITIDVAYRFFATEKRKFIVADTPGHEQYTRNMATGASTADLAVILVDARKGLQVQTRRHSYIASLFGIRHAVLAVNKMDAIGFDEDVFRRIEAEYQAFARDLGFETLMAIPMSARDGDNVIAGSERTPWYRGPSLLAHLEEIDAGIDLDQRPLRLPIQWVNRPNADFRGFCGTIASGRLRVGDEVTAANSGKNSRVKRILDGDLDVESAHAGDAVTLILADEIDISRGDLIAAAGDRPQVSDQFTAHLVWMHDHEMLPGRSYVMKSAGSTVIGSISELKYKVDVNTFQHIAGKTLQLNEIGAVNLSLSSPIAFDPYAENRATGSFIVIDRLTNATVGAGMIDFGLRRATNVHWQALDVNKSVRATLKHQKPCALWFTGLSGAGKSTIANLVDRRLAAAGRHTYLLDGDNIRHGLNRDLGFTDADRVENIRRVAEVARLLVDAGLIVLVSFISPFRSERRMARELFDKDEFIEVFVDTPMEECQRRDPKGLYKRALAGQISNFTGLDSPYEAPENPEMRLLTTTQDADALAEFVLDQLRSRGHLA